MKHRKDKTHRVNLCVFLVFDKQRAQNSSPIPFSYFRRRGVWKWLK